MLRKTLTGLLAGAAIALALGALPAAAQELTIFWAEWDPANYLQELVNDYTERPASRSPSRPRPGRTSRPRPSPSSTPRATPTTWSSATCQWLGAGSTGGHYVDLTDFFNKHKRRRDHGARPRSSTMPSIRRHRKYWAIPLEGDAIGWAYRKDWFEDPKEMEAFKAKYGYDLARAEDLQAQLRDIAEFFYRPDEKRYGIAIYTDNSYDGMAMGVESALFSYGGELGDYSTYKVDGIVNSDKAVAALEMYKDLYKFTPPGWGKTFFQEDNQAITENLAAMSMNFFAFFPALINPATNPNAKDTGFFANPAGPDGEPASPRSAGRASRSSPTRRSRTRR